MLNVYTKKNNIPLPKNVNFYLSQIQADGNNYQGKDDFNSNAPSTVDAPEWNIP